MNAAGVVEAVSNKPVKTKFGEKLVYSAKVSGEWYKFGFKNPSLAVGEEVELNYTPGTYGNEVSGFTKATGKVAAPAAAEAAAPAPRPSYSGGSKGVFPIPPLDGQRAIVRQNAITNARELVVAALGPKGFALDIDSHTKLIIDAARRFEAYACGDDAMEAAKAAVAGESTTKH